MIELSGSRIHRVWRCPASAVYPQDSDEDLEAKHEPARNQGKAVHRYLERVKAIGREAALDEVADSKVRELCNALDLDNLPAHMATEVAFAYNWRLRGARELGRNLGHRDYRALGVDPTCEIGITVDATGTQGRRGYVGDYKKGHTRYPRPGEFGQTLLGAQCARLVWDLDDVIVELLYIDDNGQAIPVRDTVDSWALDVFGDEIAATMESLPVLEARYSAGAGLAGNQGPHCHHCAAYKHCSAKVGLLRALPEELAKVGVEVDMFGVWTSDTRALTAAAAAAWWHSIEAIEDVVAKVKSEICNLGYVSPIDLGDGRWIGQYETKRRHVDGRTAVRVLADDYGKEEALAAAELKVTLSAIESVVRKHIKQGQKMTSKKGDGLVDRILQRIDKAGGLASDVTAACGPHKRPGKKLAAKNGG